MRHGKPSHTTEHGATFIELLIAIVIFIVAGLGIAGAYLSAQQLSDDAQSTMLAMDDLRDIVERIHATPFSTIPTNFPANVADGGAGQPYATIVGGYTLPSERILVQYPTQSADRLELVVTLSWSQRNRARAISLSTMRVSNV